MTDKKYTIVQANPGLFAIDTKREHDDGHDYQVRLKYLIVAWRVCEGRTALPITSKGPFDGTVDPAALLDAGTKMYTLPDGRVLREDIVEHSRGI